MEKPKILIFGFGIMAMLGGCTVKEFTPKALNSGADRIAVVSQLLSNCKYISDVYGYDERPDVVGEVTYMTKERMRQGALNDMKNKAIGVALELKRPTILIKREKPVCSRLFVAKECDPNKDLSNYIVVKYSIEGEIYDCSDKN